MPLSTYRSSIRNISDYSPFGVQLDGRTVSSEEYRFGFQGQEKDDEVKGDGNSVNYKFRMHDPRVGRFFAVDPLARAYSYNSPYAFSENVVINARELEGKELDFAFRVIDMLLGEEKLKQTTAGTIVNRVGEWYTGEVVTQGMQADYASFKHSPSDYYMEKLYDAFTMDAYSQSKGLSAFAKRVANGDPEAYVDLLANLSIMWATRKVTTLPEVVVEAPKPKMTMEKIVETSTVRKAKPKAKESYYERSGSYEDAVNDFNNLEGITNVKPIEGKHSGLQGELSDGTKVSVRSGSAGKHSGRSEVTLQFKTTGGKSTKVRYGS